MKIVQINTVPNGSTGTIMMNIHKELLKQGHDSYVVWGRGRNSNNDREIYMNDKFGVYFHVIYSRITGKTGFASKRSTRKLLKKLDNIKPDIIHLHNIHGYYINIDILFNYIKLNSIRVIWTLHDCWPFTGHCVHFDYINCHKWRKECYNCPQKELYPKSIFDSSKWNFDKKKNLFRMLNSEDVTIVTPSKWLSSMVNNSFLNKYITVVINNGIDTKTFKRLENSKLKFKKKYNLNSKKIILGVANPWTKRKGLNDFIELSKILKEDYKVVMVGLTKKQIKTLPSNILGLEKTSNIEELVDIYNSSDILFNASVEETFGMTCVEALACGIKTVVYNKTALPEVANYKNGYVIEEKDYAKIVEISKMKLKKCEKIYSCDDMANEYINLYLKRR